MLLTVIALVLISIGLIWLIAGARGSSTTDVIPTGRVIDWRYRGWGHDYVIEGRRKDGCVTMFGWHHDLRVGDTLIIYGLQWESDARAGKRSPDPATYLVEWIAYRSDPADMFDARVRETGGEARTGEAAGPVIA